MTELRTVRNVLEELVDEPEMVAEALGIDPDMPFEQFQRWLSYGKNADTLTTHPTHEGYLSETTDVWNDCLNFIKGGDR